MAYPETKRPAAVGTASLLETSRSLKNPAACNIAEKCSPDKEHDAAEFAGMSVSDFEEPPTHPDAQRLWPVLLFVYAELIDAGRELLPVFPRQANLCGRMAEAIRGEMIDAELGILNASAERRAAFANKKGAAS